MGNDGAARILQIISPSARTGFGVPWTSGGGPGGTSTALTVASGADSITVTSPISMPFRVQISYHSTISISIAPTPNHEFRV